ncbi:hypothetical protein BGX34_002675, partial [Mortierella sp. NVP85]
MFNSIVSSPLEKLSALQALELANVYLENANNAHDPATTLVLCHDTEVSLSQARKAGKHAENQSVNEGIGLAYISLGILLESRGHTSGAEASYKLARKLGIDIQNPTQSSGSSRSSGFVRAFKDTFHSTGSSRGHGSIRHFSLRLHKQGRQGRSPAKIPPYIFAKNVSPPTPDFKLPEADERLADTPQLVHCLGLLQDSRSIDDIIEPAARKWLQTVVKDTDEQERLKTMSTEVIRAFKRDEIKDAGVVNEVVCLAPVLNKDVFADLLSEFYKEIDHSGLLRVHHIEGLAQLIQSADPGHLNADDLVKILELLSTRLRDTHQQSSNNMHQLTLAVSHVLDAMTDTKVTGLDRERLHEPLSTYLEELKGSEDAYLIYQAAYAYQALLCVPDNESMWQAALRRTGRVVFGFSGIASAVKDLDLSKFVESLESIQKGVAGAANIVHTVATVYGDVKSLADSGQSFLECLKESFSTKGKRAWYSALRGADTLIRDGELILFKKL